MEQSEQKYRALLDYVRVSTLLVQDMEEELKRALKMEEVGKIMVPALLHDLGNIIGAIRSSAQFCAERIGAPSEIMENLQLILECSEKAAGLIKTFLDTAKSAKAKDFEFQSVDINASLLSMWKTARTQVEHEILFEEDLDPRLPAIRGDTAKLERVFLNLLLNAIQSAGKGGKVTVRTRYLPGERQVAIDIIDSGPGVPEELREKIFEPFFTTKKGGTGLGLSMCRYIIEQHRGTISLDTAWKDGAKFTISLPETSDGEISFYQ